MVRLGAFGDIVEGPDGKRRVEWHRIPPPPAELLRSINDGDDVEVPDQVWHAISKDRGFLCRVMGDSMEPGILDNDTIVVIRRAPKSGDVVIVNAPIVHALYGTRREVWRFRDGFLFKDQPRYRRMKPVPVRSEDVEGVVTRVIPRMDRSPLENYARIEQCRLLGATRRDLGFYKNLKRDLLRRVVRIPESELIDGRLPWGCFRGLALTHHAGIRAGDTLTIDPDPFPIIGKMVIHIHSLDGAAFPFGDIAIGILRKDTQRPGDSYIDTLRGRIYTHRVDPPVIRQIGTIGSVAKPRGGWRRGHEPALIGHRVARRPKGNRLPDARSDQVTPVTIVDTERKDE